MSAIDTEILNTIQHRLQRMLTRHSEYSKAELDLAKIILATIDHARLEHELARDARIQGLAA